MHFRHTLKCKQPRQTTSSYSKPCLLAMVVSIDLADAESSTSTADGPSEVIEHWEIPNAEVASSPWIPLRTSVAASSG